MNLKIDYINYRIEKAKEALDDAKLLASNKSWNAAINRLYYACFYAISALLVLNDINVKTHEGVKMHFSKFFIKTGIFDQKYGQLFSDIMNMRHKGDYGDLFDFNEQNVEPLIMPIEELVLYTINHINIILNI